MWPSSRLLASMLLWRPMRLCMYLLMTMMLSLHTCESSSIVSSSSKECRDVEDWLPWPKPACPSPDLGEFCHRSLCTSPLRSQQAPESLSMTYLTPKRAASPRLDPVFGKSHCVPLSVSISMHVQDQVRFNRMGRFSLKHRGSGHASSLLTSSILLLCDEGSIALQRLTMPSMRLRLSSSRMVSVLCSPVTIQSSWWCSVRRCSCGSVSEGHMRRKSGMMSCPCTQLLAQSLHNLDEFPAPAIPHPVPIWRAQFASQCLMID